MLSPATDQADQRRADQFERCESFLRDAVRHLEVAGIDRALIVEALRRLAGGRGGMIFVPKARGVEPPGRTVRKFNPDEIFSSAAFLWPT
jgi:hypothetical protein